MTETEKVKTTTQQISSQSEVAQSCPALCDPHQVPPSMGFSRQEYWSELSFPSPGDLPNPGIESGSPTLQADTLPSEPPEKPQISSRVNQKKVRNHESCYQEKYIL